MRINVLLCAQILHFSCFFKKWFGFDMDVMDSWLKQYREKLYKYHVHIYSNTEVWFDRTKWSNHFFLLFCFCSCSFNADFVIKRFPFFGIILFMGPRESSLLMNPKKFSKRNCFNAHTVTKRYILWIIFSWIFSNPKL